MPKAALAAAFLFVLCLGGWFLLQGPAAPPDPGSDHTAATSGEPVTVATPGVSPADLAPPIERRALTEPTPLLPPPDDAEWIELRVVDATTRAPVPGATVGWYDLRITRELARRPELLPLPIGVIDDVEAVAGHFGWRTTADRNGVARIQRSGHTTVFARHGECYGESHLELDMQPPPEGFQIRIGTDLTLRVRVIDCHGEPAIDVPLGIAIHDRGGQVVQLLGHRALAISSAADGCASFAHVQHWLREHEDARRHGRRWAIVALLPHLAGDPLPLPSLRADGEPAILRLPPTGSLRAELTSLTTGLDHPTLSIREYAHPRRMGNPDCLQTVVATDGSARFAHLLLGKQYELSISTAGGTLRQIVAGPTVAGQEVEVAVAFTSADLRLEGRVLDEQRRPLAGREVTLRLTGPEFEGPFTTRSEADGHFTLLLGSDRDDPTLHTIQLETLAGDGVLRTVRLPGRALTPGVTDLGDLVLGPAPIVVAGRFFVDGKPSRPEVIGELQRLRNPGDPSEGWQRLAAQLPEIDADGRFAQRGHLEPGRHRMVLWGADLQPVEPIEFRAGTTDLRIDLQTGHRLAVTLLLPAGTQSRLESQLVPMPPESAMTAAVRERLAAHSSPAANDRQQLTWRGLPSGRYRLELRLPAFAALVHSIDDIVVPSADAPDPRLLDADLTGHLRLQSLQVVDAAGQAVPTTSWRAMQVPPAGHERHAELVPQSNPQVFLMPAGEVELLVHSVGYRPQRIWCSGSPVVVQLARWPKVDLEPPRLADWPADWRLQVRLDAPVGLEGPLHDLESPPNVWQNFVDDHTRLQVGDWPQRIRLRAVRGRQRVELPIPPQSVSSSTGTWAVQVDADAVRRTLATARQGR